MARRTTRWRKGEDQDEVTPVSKPEKKAVRPAADVAPRDKVLDIGELEAIANMSAADIEAMMMGSSTTSARLGERVTGTLTMKGRERSLVDIGAKSEAWIATSEVADLEVGASVSAFVVATGEEILLSTTAQGAAADEILMAAKEAGTAIEGTVTGRNPGGFDVKLGDVRAFCPVSQIDRFPGDPDSYVGQTFSFLVLEADGDVVVSRRAWLEEQASGDYDAFWQSASIGDEHEGIVTNTTDFGVFVDIGGVEGLVHRSELGWGNNDPKQFSRGDRLSVRVTDLRPDDGKVGLSAKDPANSPWRRSVGSTFVEGKVYSGPVKAVEAFGAFVELAPGLDGLLHVSRAGGPLPKVGETVEVRLDRIDHERQRLELSAPGFVATETERAPVVEEEVTGTVRDVLGNGVVVDLEDGRSAWLPARNADLPGNTVLAQRFRRGHTLTARVDPTQQGGGKRVVLTQQAVESGDWRGGKTKQATSFGTLGDLLKDWRK